MLLPGPSQKADVAALRGSQRRWSEQVAVCANLCYVQEPARKKPEGQMDDKELQGGAEQVQGRRARDEDQQVHRERAGESRPYGRSD